MAVQGHSGEEGTGGVGTADAAEFGKGKIEFRKNEDFLSIFVVDNLWNT
jgi:hypothetical protein